MLQSGPAVPYSRLGHLEPNFLPVFWQFGGHFLFGAGLAFG